MVNEFLPSRGRDNPKPQPEPRRFVPTLTEVVHVPPGALAEPVSSGAAGQAGHGTLVTGHGVDEETVARVCASVMQGMDEPIRAAIQLVLQEQQQALVQSMAAQLVPLVEAKVRDALVGISVQAARQNGEGCIRATD